MVHSATRLVQKDQQEAQSLGISGTPALDLRKTWARWTSPSDGGPCGGQTTFGVRRSARFTLERKVPVVSEGDERLRLIAGCSSRAAYGGLPTFPPRDLVPERRAAAAEERADARPLLAADRRADAGADARGRSDDDRALLHRAFRLPDDDAFGRALIAVTRGAASRVTTCSRIRGAHDTRVLERRPRGSHRLESGLVRHRAAAPYAAPATRVARRRFRTAPVTGARR